MAARFFDPQAVAISVFGSLIQGFSEDSMVKAEQMSEGFTSVVGVDGEVARSKSSDRRVRVTLSLLQTSASNAILSAQHTLDLNAPNGAGVGTFHMSDLQGGTFIHGDQCWIVKYPDNEMAKEAKTREWILEIANVTRFEGGN